MIELICDKEQSLKSFTDNACAQASFAWQYLLKNKEIKVNGKKAKTYSLNGFLVVELVEGENVIEMDYTPKGLALGVTVFALGVLLLGVYLLFNKRIKNFKKLDGACKILTLCLGAIVVLAIYLIPTAFCIVGYAI